jgi:hypothetical protein
MQEMAHKAIAGSKDSLRSGLNAALTSIYLKITDNYFALTTQNKAGLLTASCQHDFEE